MTIPNLISLFRLFSVPVLFVLALLDLRTAFIVLFTAAALSDKLDGIAAILLKQRSEFGARLDSFADEFFYDSTPLWLLILVPEVIFDNIPVWIFIAFFGFLLIAITFEKLGVHTVLNQINAGLFLVFAFYTFVFGYNATFFYISAAGIILAKIENLLLYIKYNGNIPPETKSFFS